MKAIKSGYHEIATDSPLGMTTGEAAALCSVKPDTILKWIKKGKLRAVRTAGGHHRIGQGDLQSFLRSHRGEGDALPPDERAIPAVRCWEFFSEQGAPRDGCTKCVVFRVRAALCFELLGLGKEVGHAKVFCRECCEECTYYRRVKGLKINVLVVSRDEDLIGSLGGPESETLSLRFARNAYEASALIHDFHPAFAVVDRSLFTDGGMELVECLTADPRLPGLKIILAVSGGGNRRRKESEQVAAEVLVKPFGPDRVAAVVNKLPVESLRIKDGDAT